MSGKLPVVLVFCATLLGGIPAAAAPSLCESSATDDHYRPWRHGHGPRVVVRRYVRGRGARVIVVRRPVTAAPAWMVRGPVVVQWERTVIDDASVDEDLSDTTDLEFEEGLVEGDDLSGEVPDDEDGPYDAGEAEDGDVPTDAGDGGDYVFANEQETWQELERMEAEDDAGENPGEAVSAPSLGTNPPAAMPPSLSGPLDSPAAIPSPAAVSPADSTSAVFLADMEQKILELVNREREAAGLAALANAPLLTVAARRHSREMAELGFFAHESPTEENRSLGMRLANAGLASYGWSGENLALSTSASAEEFVRMWMDSPGHRENLLRPEFKFSGIGVYTDGHKTWATQDFTSAN